ncbi:branched-chain amino acid ABC transporter permease [Pseudoruegeria sp. HB172150]|uniref:branched-chain amino acid ABC transporter permease n=1 Tax=Pseudoruegeria sp. HB172150 TaxID=2721164 RepID=UPI0015577970|nr:branched-chain amino acid ABC transporter permease [Pseudoruegeria sp. HB172150]
MTTTTEIDRPRTPPRAIGLAKTGLVLAAALALPLMLQRYQLGLVSNAMILALGAIALNVVMGLAGLVSAGNAALFAVGAYGAATCAVFLGLPFPLTLLVCAALGALVGLLVGLPALRVRGIYLAIATLALHYVVIFVLSRYQAGTVGPMGFVLPKANLFGFVLNEEWKWYYLILVSLVLCFVAVNNIKASRIGRAWMLLRDSPIAAASQGIAVSRYKLLAFVFSSAIIGFSGGLHAYYHSNVYIEAFPLELAIQVIAMIVIGGWGSTGGAIAGAFFISLLPTALSLLLSVLPRNAAATEFLARNVGDVQLIVYGGLIIGFLVLEPDGLAGLWKRWEKRLLRGLGT